MLGFSILPAAQGPILPVELHEGRVKKCLPLGCVGLLTGSFGFCWSITFSFTTAFIHKKCFLLLFLLHVFNSSLTPGTVRPRCAPLSDSQTQETFSPCTTGVVAVFGADKRRAAGGLPGGSMRTTADGAVIMSRPASEEVKEGLHTGGLLCCRLQVVQHW